jgi:MFS family permease
MALKTTSRPASNALIVLIAVAVVNYIDRSLLSILQVGIKKDLGLSDTQLGALTGLAFGLFYSTAALPLSRFADRVRRTWMIAACLAVWTTMTALTSLAASFITLAFLRIGVAFGEAGCTPATHSLLCDYYAPRRRGAVFGLWAITGPVGIMLGILAGGWFKVSWRTSFMLVGAVGWLLVPVVLCLKEPRRGQFETAVAVGRDALQPPAFMVAIKILMSQRAFRLLITAATLQTFAVASMQNWTPPFYSRIHHLPLSQVATLSGLIMGLGGGVGALFGGVIVDIMARRDPHWYSRAPAFATLLSIPLAFGQFLTSTTGISVFLGVLTMLTATLYVAPLYVTAQTLVPPSMRAFTSAVVLLIPNILGVGPGPFFVGVMSDALARLLGDGESALRYAISSSLLMSALAAITLFRVAKEMPMVRHGTTSDIAGTQAGVPIDH